MLHRGVRTERSQPDWAEGSLGTLGWNLSGTGRIGRHKKTQTHKHTNTAASKSTKNKQANKHTIQQTNSSSFLLVDGRLHHRPLKWDSA